MKEIYKLEDKYLFNNLKNDEKVLVLDSGCGNGNWCLDKMDIFPKDIKPMNCFFEEKDLFEYISTTQKKFNLITQRFMAMYLKEDEWKKILDNYYNILKLGGYINIVESNLIVSNIGNKTKKFAEQFKYGLKARRINPYINNNLEEIIKSSKYEKMV